MRTRMRWHDVVIVFFLFPFYVKILKKYQIKEVCQMMKQVAGVLLNRLTGTHVRSIIVMTNNQEVLYELQERKGRSSP
ncbi:MAG: hypothetical protein K0Q90_1692 [Paenibacillaceae bacterium]|jgi:peroxiredoxin|nr:hypothetical protein [Paenibacillaceae bacterium]